MMLLREVKTVFLSELQAILPEEEIQSCFHLSVEHLFGYARFILVLRPDLAVTDAELRQLFGILDRLKRNEPIQYILGVTEFMGYDIKVDARVLIPRPETEELVHWILETCAERKAEPLRILDIGTGSGCIAIALAHALPSARVFALDRSEDALEVARANAKSHQLDITFLSQDILAPFESPEAFDLIVSNPPYVRESEKKEMADNVLEFEPKQALYVPDAEPLLFYDAITRFAKQQLAPEGHLFFEINQYLGQETESILLENGFENVVLKTDIFGNFRMLKGSMTKS
ncbi:peptide chain release factor N(5)-glutamine methyltransferase [Flagellimonas sp. DF-77]|uniref:peptide chain release factor N(5)-glutamine methyltransferase n=1 Tax=Flagellimonas algarum TaxID=3230298 RepID=UPI00339B17E6